MSLDEVAIQLAAERLRHAQTTSRGCAPVREIIGDSRRAAYAVQARVAQLQQISGAKVVGRKLGLISPAVRVQLGVAEPTIGTLMDSMRVADGDVVSIRRLLQPRIEAEIAFELDRDLADPDTDAGAARAAVGRVYAALEVIDSRIFGWDIAAVDTIADNASAGLFVLSAEGVPLGEEDLREMRMEITRDSQVVSSGYGRDNCFGDPVEGLAWLAREAIRHGEPLTAGMFVLAGSLGGLVDIEEGDSFTGRIGNLPSVQVHFRSSSALAALRVADSEADSLVG